MCPVERERDPSGCRASGLPPELPVHVVLVPPLLVPPLLVPPLLIPAVVGSAFAGSADVGSAVVGSVAGSLSGAGSAAASSSGAGTDGATSTASRLLLSGLSSEVVVVTKKAPDCVRAGDRIV